MAKFSLYCFHWKISCSRWDWGMFCHFFSNWLWSAHFQQLVIDTYFDWYWLVTCGGSFKWYTHLTEPATYQGRSPMGAHSVSGGALHCLNFGLFLVLMWSKRICYIEILALLSFSIGGIPKKCHQKFFRSLKRSSRFFIPKKVQQNSSCTPIPDSFQNAALIFGAS